MPISDDQLFTPEELEINQRNRDALFDLIKSKDSILMAGAGCTASLYPNWRNLLDLLTKEAQEQKPDFVPFNEDTEDFLKFASRVKNCFGEKDRFYHLIFDIFKPGPLTHEIFHEALCKLPFRGITTTNYDIVLEYALKKITNGKSINYSIWIEDGVEKAEIFEFLMSLNHGKAQRKVFHIHGIHHRKNSIILCDSEYEEKYGFSTKSIESVTSLYQNVKGGFLTDSEFKSLLTDHGMVWTPLRKILWSLFATRRMVFMGFSMDDPYFKKMLDFVSNDLHTYNSDAHYIILRITKDSKERIQGHARMLKKRYGIQAVFFEDDKNYKGLERFVYELDKEINSELSQEKRELVIPLENGDKYLTEELFKISREKDDHGD